MKKILIAGLLVAGCGPAPTEYGGLTEIGITEMAVRLGCPFENVRIENRVRGLTKSTWDAVCIAPRKALSCSVNPNGTTACQSK